MLTGYYSKPRRPRAALLRSRPGFCTYLVFKDHVEQNMNYNKFRLACQEFYSDNILKVLPQRERTVTYALPSVKVFFSSFIPSNNRRKREFFIDKPQIAFIIFSIALQVWLYPYCPEI